MLDLSEALSSGVALDAGFALGASRWGGKPDYSGPERRSAASQQLRQLAQLMDAIDYGMVLLQNGNLERVAMVNKAARQALDEHYPLLLVDHTVVTRHAQDAQLLRDAMLSAARRGLRRLLQLGSGEHRVSVAVVPLQSLGTQPGWGVALLLGKRQVCEALTVDWFARAHGLTLAETAVIRGLCADLTPQEIAERQGVGLATVRTQIGSIRTKTGAGSIRALVRQVALLPPLVNVLQSSGMAAVDTLGEVTARARRSSGSAHRLNA